MNRYIKIAAAAVLPFTLAACGTTADSATLERAAGSQLQRPSLIATGQDSSEPLGVTVQAAPQPVVEIATPHSVEAAAADTIVCMGGRLILADDKRSGRCSDTDPSFTAEQLSAEWNMPVTISSLDCGPDGWISDDQGDTHEWGYCETGDPVVLSGNL